ncbi:hypothetical protein JCGZ_05826 [Jatropha curcas]|uniref:Tetraspanin n=1 Tax=Jatropha curcas TaxID=180498 RepID=A0A067J8N3_JATCU|nr:tetraspanin-11 [Jatropha curcas]KDP20057.1 hypothetical protein JCGZ_05826 [Jatropha curcas]
MVRVGNVLLGFLNGIILIAGLAAIGTGLYFVLAGNSQCVRGVHNQLMITGAALVVVSLLGIIGSCYRINFFLIIYLVVMFLLIVALLIFTIFSFLVSHATSGDVVSRLKVINFRTWIRDHFVNDKNWEHIRNCLIDAKICNSLGDSNDMDKDVKDFFKKNLSPMQSGCCKPPSECGFEYKNATYWVMPKAGPAVNNSECKTWSNQQDTLCYNCESCKDGIVKNIKHKWKQLAILNCCIVVVLIILYCLGCCVRRTNSYRSYPKLRGYRPYP